MNWLTRLSLQIGTYSFTGFLTFISVINPITRVGAGIVILGIALYIAADTFKQYTENYQENHTHNQSLQQALSANSTDIVFFVLFVIIGFYLGFN